MAKMRPGIFTHRYVDFGNYQQCLDVVHEQDKFIGQYSLIQIRWNQSNHELYNFENFVSAICYPSTCERSDIETILNHFNSRLDIEIKLITIETRETSSSGYSAPKIIAGLILLSLFGISHLSTTLCFYFEEERMPQVIKLFNCGSHWEKLTADTPSGPEKRLQFFNGIRVLYLICAICVHLYIPLRPMLSAMYLPEAQFFESNRITGAIAKILLVPAGINFVIG